MAYFDNEAGSHSPWRIILILLNILVYIGTLALSTLSNTGSVPELYNNTISSVSSKYRTEVIPVSGTFSIWIGIYVWQALYMLYTLSLIFRKGKSGHYLYVKPEHIHYSFYIMYMLTGLIVTSWSFLFDREEIALSFVFLFFTAFSLYLCGVIVCRSLDRAGGELEKQGNRIDIHLTRFFVLNGIAVYATWTTVATWISLPTVLQYRAGINGITAAWISLGILAGIVSLWFILETFVFDRYLRYCFSQYIVLIVAFTGIFLRHYDPADPEDYLYFVLVLLSLSSALALVKVVIMVVKGMKYPIIYKTAYEPTTDEGHTNITALY